MKRLLEHTFLVGSFDGIPADFTGTAAEAQACDRAGGREERPRRRPARLNASRKRPDETLALERTREGFDVWMALNDLDPDGRDVSWIWDVDFEPLIDGLDRLVATGDRAAELALRFKYGGLDAGAIEVIPSLERALDRGLELTPAGGELVLLPTYTAMLALRKIVGARGFVRPYWERAA